MAFSRDAIINQLYTSPEVDAAISKMNPAHLREELKQEMFLVLCKLPEDRLKEMHEKQYIKWFLVRTMTNMIQSDRSTFYNTFRKEREQYLHGHYFITRDGELANGGTNWEHESTPYDLLAAKLLPEGLIADEPEESIWLDSIPEAIADIDPYEAELIKLYAIMGGTCKPIAKATGISERGVRFAVAKAREKLQKKLRA